MIEVSVSKIKSAFSEYLNRAAYGRERIIILSRGKPKAAMIGMEDLRRLEELEDAVVRDWEATLEEIELAGDDLPDILQAREEARAGIGMTPDELRAYLEDQEQ